ASLEINLRKLGIVLGRHQKEKLLQKIVDLGDKGEKVSAEDLPLLIKRIISNL
ncbi:MAG: 2-isopropylmalate synthase, partial [Candidatus Nealsonbacteria bacterium]|nr:2-isopropylmalate synthase [Candidatus Nealsonbacteria bacterium]